MNDNGGSKSIYTDNVSIDENELIDIIHSTPNRSCDLDIIHIIWLFKYCLPELKHVCFSSGKQYLNSHIWIMYSFIHS